MLIAEKMQNERQRRVIGEMLRHRLGRTAISAIV
jgi:hypothetical protein